jgi:chromosome segregation ATPase
LQRHNEALVRRVKDLESSKAVLQQELQITNEKCLTLERQLIEDVSIAQSSVIEAERKTETLTKLSDELQTETKKLSVELANKTEMLESLEADFTSTKDQCDTISQELKTTTAHKSKLNEAIRMIRHLLERFASSPRKQREAISELVDQLNPLLELIGVPSVQLDSRDLELRSMHYVVASIFPQAETLTQKSKAIMNTIREVLLSFPIGDQKFDFESHDLLEAQLTQLRSVIEMIRRLFDEREKHIEELASMIAAQHQAVLQISSSRKDISALTASQANFRRSHGILESDREGRIAMVSSMRSSLTPQRRTSSSS